MKYMEMIFALAVVASLLLAGAADRDAAAATGDASVAVMGTLALEQHVASAGTMAVVIVKGKRLTSREKRRAALADADMRIF